jgi:hypothetical protein
MVNNTRIFRRIVGTEGNSTDAPQSYEGPNTLNPAGLNRSISGHTRHVAPGGSNYKYAANRKISQNGVRVIQLTVLTE